MIRAPAHTTIMDDAALVVAASTALESARQSHEEVERLTWLSVEALQARGGALTADSALTGRIPAGSALEAERLVRTLVDSARARCRTLANAYSNADGDLSRAAGALGADGALSAFYAQVREIRDQHRADTGGAPGLRARDEALVLSTLAPAAFSAEEMRGRCLDLHALHARFVNVAGVKPAVEYVAYVRSAVVDFSAVPAARRRAGAYASYLADLAGYLAGFADRAYPLEDVQELVAAEKARLREKYEEDFRGIAERFGDAGLLLEALGEKQVTQRLGDLGLKAGGRPPERAKRLLQHARKGTVVDHVLLEGLVAYLAVDLLAEERSATAMNAEKKLSLSYAEIEAERLAEEAAAAGAVQAEEEGDEDEEGIVYNPKDVPLGWDGKPMPYWLYKLHGLNHEYKCEICGDKVYRGPRAFERHFAGAQHVQGLRCLGISYSKEFLWITRISDALALHERLQRGDGKGAGGEDGMEYEDAEGNVLSKKTYDDLARQGLL